MVRQSHFATLLPLCKTKKPSKPKLLGLNSRAYISLVFLITIRTYSGTFANSAFYPSAVKTITFITRSTSVTNRTLFAGSIIFSSAIAIITTAKTDRSRNELIGIFLEYALDRCKVENDNN